MTKCLQLARMFHAQGDRVIVAETAMYKFCGTRFSSAVDKFVIIPAIVNDGTDYQNALIDICNSEKVDLYIPVASPKSAYQDAVAKSRFPAHTVVFHFDADIVKILDDKHLFIEQAGKYGLSVPESFIFNSKNELLDHSFTEGKKYILKKIDYDPVYRLDLRRLPHDGWEDRVNSLPINSTNPWVLQEFIEGREVCTHTTTQDGAMNLYICSDSSPFQVNYAMLDLPNVRAWVSTFVSKLNATGQISFDFIIKDNGTVIPIECNPRTHSAITLFHNQHKAAAAYYDLGRNCEKFIPNEVAGHTYWIFHELHRLIKCMNLKVFKLILNRIWTGKEAVFQWNDPWPFFFNNFISIPYQIIKNLTSKKHWTGIDFNIGKLIIQGGD